MMKRIKEQIKKTKLYKSVKNILYQVQKKKIGIVDIFPTEPGIRPDYRLNGHKVIVSLTSFPARIPYLHKTLYSLLSQSVKPTGVYLWLAENQFPNKEHDLPKDILDLIPFGLEIRWTERDIRSYKKLIPTLRSEPDAIIVTADDDLYYHKKWLEYLIESYTEFPDYVHSTTITRIRKENNSYIIAPREGLIGTASFCNKLLGGSGCLYSPNCFENEVLDEEKFMRIAPTSDDLWFWIMAVKAGKKIRWIPKGLDTFYYVENTQESTPRLCDTNDHGEKLFFCHLENLIKEYDLDDILSE